MRFNINGRVLVQLTDHGRAVYKADHEAFCKEIGRELPLGMPKEDEGGWSKWQLHSLMSAFGKHIGLGLPLCFQTEIDLLTEATTFVAPVDHMAAVRAMCK